MELSPIYCDNCSAPVGQGDKNSFKRACLAFCGDNCAREWVRSSAGRVEEIIAQVNRQAAQEARYGVGRG